MWRDLSMTSRQTLTRPTAALAALLTLSLTDGALSQQRPDAEPAMQRLFVHYQDGRAFDDKALAATAMPELRPGRSFALLAAISHYPNMIPTEQTLAPAAADVDKLARYLRQQEYFDEIVVLEGHQVSERNLAYFLDDYFPRRLRAHPGSRLLFAYSGLGTGKGDKGYLLKHTARGLNDRRNVIALATLRPMLDASIDAGHQVLVLVNASHGRALVKRNLRNRSFAPQRRGAHAITAGGSATPGWRDPESGTGSLFFETLLAGLAGAADTRPATGDGIISVDELANHLAGRVTAFGAGASPRFGDLAPSASLGGFFFLNQQRQRDAGIGTPWRAKQQSATRVVGDSLQQRARAEYRRGNYDEAMRRFKQAHGNGNSASAFFIGYMFEHGQGRTRQPPTAAIWYERGARAGDAQAATYLGLLLRRDPSLPGSEKAAQWLLRGANAGNARAMRKLGEIHERGGGVAPDPAKAFFWYQRGAVAGDAWCMNALARHHRDGRGTSRNAQQAAAWFQQSALLGNAEAMASLATLYETGDGVPRDQDQAVDWFHRSAEAGHAWAMGKLGWIYESGAGVPRDLAAALEWYRSAADAGDRLSMNELGRLYRAGIGVERDDKAAAGWFRKAADADYAPAMTDLGLMYQKGLGVGRNEKQAFVWYQAAALAGDNRGMGNLGWMYREGRGVTVNYGKALFWLRKAADGGNARAMGNLGWMYEQGLGIAPDVKAALSWYRDSASRGDDWSQERLSRLGAPQ